VDDENGGFNPAGYPAGADEGLAGAEPPGAAVEGQMKGEDRDAVLLPQVVQV